MHDLFRYGAGVGSSGVGTYLLWTIWTEGQIEHREWPEVTLLLLEVVFFIGAWYLFIGIGLLWVTRQDRHFKPSYFRRFSSVLYISLLFLTILSTWIITELIPFVRLSVWETIYLNILIAGLIGSIIIFLSTMVGQALAVHPQFRVFHLLFGVLMVAIIIVWDMVSLQSDIVLLVLLLLPVLFYFGWIAVTLRLQSRLHQILLRASHILFGVFIAILTFILEDLLAPTSHITIISVLLVVILPPYLGWMYLGILSSDELYAGSH